MSKKSISTKASLAFAFGAVILLVGCGASVRKANVSQPSAPVLTSNRLVEDRSKPTSLASPWDRVDALRPGACCLVVTLRDGSRVKGRFGMASSDELTVLSREDKEKRLAKGDIRRVVRRNRDHERNGVLLGLASGFGAGAGLGYAVSTGLDVATRVTIPVLGAVGAATGALVGYLIDRSRVPKEVLFEADGAS